ncbi:phenylacetate--CoA ligase family protein [Candidatus Woesearchaeota archaeon]|nr:MAG: phenylacetate--CoA ligase family protein [Candidatus Woesearchaeota archaeon]
MRFKSFLHYLHFRFKRKGDYWRTLLEQISYENMPLEELRRIQFEKTKRLLIHAYENVPFYRKKFDAAGFNPYKFKSMKQYSSVPVTTKEELRNAGHEQTKAKGIPADRFVSDKTAGSTGKPLFFFKDSAFEVSEACALLREHLRAGVSIGDPCVILRGNPPKGLKQGLFHSTYFYSTKKFEEEKLLDFLSFLKQKRIQIIDGFPSFLAAVAKKMREKGVKLKTKAILAGGEMLFPEQRKLIQEAFSSEVFDRYGAAEGMGIAMECNLHNGLHYDPTRFVVEVLDEKSHETLVDKEGVVCLTNLENYAMPFIRYLMNDRAVLHSGRCSCGLEFPLMSSVKGRVLDALWTRSGKLLDFNMLDPYEHYDMLDGFQMVLRKDGTIEARIVPLGNPEQVKRAVEKELREYLDSSIKLLVKAVDSIPPDRTGKRPCVVVER